MKDTSALLNEIGVVYKSVGLASIGNLQIEPESQEYNACRFMLSQKKIVFRKAKITPTKIGQFVTIWKRPAPDSEIAPFDKDDAIDVVIIHCETDDKCGQFIFPAKVLWQKKVFSEDGKGGKRGIRVYPLWDTPVALQAIKTQKWQLDYFVEFGTDNSAERLTELLSDNS